jgi:catechol 2,3-dioxygenase-like lactoylglutathione lyase family enzyme
MSELQQSAPAAAPAPANRVAGVHHVAFCTADIKAQIEFFTDKLGMELVGLFWMHGVPGAWHGFLRLNDESTVAFVQSPAVAEIEARPGETHAGNPGAMCAGGTLQHLALKVRDEGELLALRDRLRSKGVPVLGPVDHGLCTSVYFAGPEGLSLELSYSEAPMDARAWIDPEVAALAGISPEELERFRRPEPFRDSGGAVPNPDASAPGPHMTNYPPGVYERVIATPDHVVRANSETEPPVRVVD